MSSSVSLPSSSSRCGWRAAIHLSDPAFTSRVDVMDAYVLPTHPSFAAPTAALVSPWLLSTPSANAAGTLVETVPLAWRCSTCGDVEVEQLYWRRPLRRRITPCTRGDGVDSTTATATQRASLARRLRLEGLSSAMKAKLERHRRRRERREEMRWRALHVSTRCRQCYLCPRCGGHGSVPCPTKCAVEGAHGCIRRTERRLSLVHAHGGTPSVSALDIRLTKDMRYFTVCPCCQWHSYQAFPSMEQLMSYLDSVAGEDKAEVMRDWRTSQRSANAVLRSRMGEVLCSGVSGAEEDGSDELLLLHDPPKPTASQAAWETYKKQRVAAAQRRASPDVLGGGAKPQSSQAHEQKLGEEGNNLNGLHPALVLEELRRRELLHRVSTPVDRQAMCVPPGAVQVMRVMDLAQEAWSYFSNLEQQDSPHTAEAARPVSSSLLLSSSSGQAAGLSEMDLMKHTQLAIMGLRAEAVDTRALTLNEWVRRYQPAAVVAQQRKAAAESRAAASPARGTGILLTSGSSPSALATLLSTWPDKTPAKASGTPMKPLSTTSAVTVADAALDLTTPETRHDTTSAATAATPSMSVLYHTPTSAYLQSLLQREHDRALGLPAYCVPRGRKEQVTGRVWRLPAVSCGDNKNVEDGEVVCIHGSAIPCTRVVVLDRPAASDNEMLRVYEHWSQLLAKQAERLCEGLPQQQQRQKSLTLAGAGEDGVDSSESDGGDEDKADELLTADPGNSAAGASRRSSVDSSAVHVAPSLSSEAAVALRKKKKKSTLPLPLFLDGTDFAAVSALPCWQYMGCRRTQTGGKAALEWHLRLVNLQSRHDLYITKLSLHDASVRGAGLFNGAGIDAVPLQLRLSSPDVPAVQLPVVLQTRYSVEERALLTQAQASATAVAAGDEETVLSRSAAALSTEATEDPLPPPPLALLSHHLPPQQTAEDLPRLTELWVTLTMPAAEGFNADSLHRISSVVPSFSPQPPQDSSFIYAAVTMEVLTPLPEIGSLRTMVSRSDALTCAAPCLYRYSVVPYGVTVLLTSE